MVEVVVAASIGAIILAQMGFFLGAFLRLEEQNRAQSQAARAGFVIQDQLVPTVSGALRSGITINALNSTTPNNVKVSWPSYDAKVMHEALFWQEGAFLYGKWTDTTVASGATTTRQKLITYDLAPAQGVKFEWGPTTRELMLTLTWQTPTLRAFARGWTVLTSQ
jgi:hypothetical protein